MKEKTVTASYVQKAVLWILVVLSALASVTKILTGFDIDEAYALAIPYRVLQGDRLFTDMWEVHQTSFLLPYLWMKLYKVMTGSMEGIVFYMRVVTTLLHLAVSIGVYLRLRNHTLKHHRQLAALLALGYYNFLPKWMITIDFSMQQLWFFTLFILCMGRVLQEQEKEEKHTNRVYLWLFLSGVLLALDVLAYPGMVLLYPAAVLLLLTSQKKDKAGKWLQVLGLTAGCFVIALSFFLYLFSYMTPQELLAAIPRVFMDGSHQYDMSTKLALYASQWLEVLIQSAILLLPAIIITIVIKIICNRTGMERKYGKLPAGLLLCLIFEIMTAALITFAGIFTTWGPFRLQVRYIIQFVMAFFLLGSLHRQKKIESGEARECRFILWLSFAAFLGILLASNVGPVSSSSYLVLGNLVFAALSILAAEPYGTAVKRLAYGGGTVFLLSLLMCKGYYMRNTEYVPGDITEPLAKVEAGPLAGIYVPVEDQIRYTEDYQTIQADTTEQDLVLFMGTEGLCNLYANGKIVIPTTISTPAFNAQWVEYFTLYPEKEPSIIFIAKNTIDDREKFFAKNEFGIWIAERYDVECMEETDSLCILRRRTQEEND